MSQRYLRPEDFVNINICGHHYKVLRSTLEQFPTTLLGNKDKRQQYFVDFLDACYFDQSREVFESILYYYQSGGSLVRPYNIPMDLYIQVIQLFGISKEAVRHMQIREGYLHQASEEEEDELPSNNWQCKVWLLMEYPESSVYARIMGLFSILVILLSILTFCIETLPKHHHHWKRLLDNCTKDKKNAQSNFSKCYKNVTWTENLSFGEDFFFIAEYLTAAWFTIEYIIRLVASPNKWKFFKSYLNLIDLCAIIPCILVLTIASKHGSSFGVIRVARLVRVLRVFVDFIKTGQILAWVVSKL